MMKTIPLLSLLLLSGLSAETTFYFHNGSATIGTGAVFDDADGTVQDTQDSFTLTAEAFLDGVSAGTDLNGATASFGINDSEAGDETQRFDNVNGIESMVFSFNQPGTFVSIDLRYIEESENEAVLIFDGGSIFQLNDSNDLTDETFNIAESFTAGQSITLQISSLAGAGENFSLESLTVALAAVPEPNAYALCLGLAGLAFVLWKRPS